MNKNLLILPLVLALLAPPVIAGEWYEGGTLHRATVADWRKGTPQNKLATAADWLAVSLWKGKIKSRADLARLKGKAQKLVNAVDAATANLDPEFARVLKAVEVSAAITSTANDLGP